MILVLYERQISFTVREARILYCKRGEVPVLYERQSFCAVREVRFQYYKRAMVPFTVRELRFPPCK